MNYDIKNIKNKMEDIQKIRKSYNEIIGNLEFYKSPVIVARNLSKIKSWKETLKKADEKLGVYEMMLINQSDREDKSYNPTNYFDSIKEELRENRKIRSMCKEVQRNLNFYKSPVLYLRNFNKMKLWKESLDEGIDKFEQIYNHLRKKYNERFNHLNSDELICEYEKKLERYRELGERRETVNSKKRKIGFFKFGKKKKINKILRDFDHPDKEYKRRRRDLQEILLNIEGKGISLEALYTNKMMENLYKREVVK